ncbi:MAG TPA: lipase family protein [Nitrospira sp.]|nr:lipase family protein [Nitrospira sp.]
MTIRSFHRTSVRSVLVSFFLLFAVLGASSCGGGKPTPSVPPTPINFSQILQYAQRAALAYEQDATIRQQSGKAVVSISSPLSSGIKAYVEQDDAQNVQWIVVRGTSNLVNIQLDDEYTRSVTPRLGIPLHKGFAEAAQQVYQFAKPLLKSGYEIRLTGHSLGGATAVIVLMLLKEDGAKLGQAITFGQPKVTNRDGAKKYGTLPLLRVVDVKDPVPFLPPIEVFALSAEGPYQQFGPELVLQDGPTYQYVSAPRAQDASILSVWNDLKNLSLHDLPEHFMSTYLTRIQQKLPQ